MKDITPTLNLKDAVTSLDNILLILCEVQEKARKHVQESNDEELKRIVIQYEAIKDRLVNEELMKLYQLANK